MCGIAGGFSFAAGAGPVDRAVVERLNECQRRRGPDGVGQWVSSDGRVMFGHRRLAIIETGATGAQPMTDSTGRWVITFNGEIYNYRELRAELQRRGRRLITNSDTEVLINVVAEWGEAGLSKLRGMFAFGLWDSFERELWLVRDPYGIKPLYVADTEGTIWFASQARALATCVPVNTARSAPGLAGFFLWGHVPEPFSWWEGIRPLAAGHVLRIRPGEAPGEPKAFSTVERIYAAAEPKVLNTKELREALLDTVRHHLIADVPIGIFLSAGVDSNVVAALAAEYDQRITAVTLAFKEYAGTARDEAPLAEAMARHINIPHVTKIIGREEFESLVDDFFDCMDQPSIDALNMFLVSRATAGQGFKVALCGLGGDEVFGGYPSFHQIPQVLKFASILAPVRGVAKYSPLSLYCVSRLLKLSPKWGGLLRNSNNLAGLYLLRRALHVEEELEMILDKYWLDHGLSILLESSRVASIALELEDARLSQHAQIAALESCAYMGNQLLRDADWAGMAHGLEIRVPFVDSHLLERLAPWIGSNAPPTKRDLAATTTVSMVELVNRPKTGFTTPVRDWAVGRSGPAPRGLRGWASEVHRRFRFVGSHDLSKQAA